MPTRRSVLATSGSALLATLAGCNVLSAGGGDDGDPPHARRWLTGEVARIPYGDAPPVGESHDWPLLDAVETCRPIRAQSVDGLSEAAMQRVESYGDVGRTSIPTDQAEEITTLFNGFADVALGEFHAPDPPADATEAGSHRGTTLYHAESDTGPALQGFAIADGTFAHVQSLPTAEDVTAGLRTLLDAEAGEGTPIEADGDVDRIWSYLEQGFWELYYADPRSRGGISLRADDGAVHRRTIMVYPSESDAEEQAAWTEDQVANAEAGDGDRSYYDFGPYDDVAVARDGRAVTVEGSLPASAVAEAEFLPP